MTLATVPTYLGFILFGIFFLVLVIYAFTRSWRRGVQAALDSVRAKLRQLHTRLNDFRSSFQSFSPGDPEPFGPIVEKALDMSVRAELVLRGLFDRYSGLHEDISRLRETRDWTIILAPVMWYRKRRELVGFAGDIVDFELMLDELSQYQGQLNQLNSDVAKGCQAILQTSNLASSAFEKLHQSGLGGKLLEQAREDVRSWQSTILNQVPVLFFSTDSEIIRSQTDKETTARVYRLSQTAEPVIAQLLNKAEGWNKNYHQFIANMAKLKEGIPGILKIIDGLSEAPSFPIIWDQTKIQVSSLDQGLTDLESLAANHDVADLAGLESESSKLYEEMVQISERLVNARSDHMELCALSLSEEIAEGPDTLKLAYQMAESISVYHVDNFPRGDAVSTLNTDLNAIASLQGRLLRYPSNSGVSEIELSGRLENSRNLAMQFKAIAPRLQRIQKKLQEVQELERVALKKIDEIKLVSTNLETLLQGNPQLRKSVGTEPIKIKNQVTILFEELSQISKGTVEKKAERCQALYSKVIKTIEKWSEQQSNEITAAQKVLSGQIGVLRELVWLDDPVMAEAEHLLSSVTSENQQSVNIASQNDELVKKFEHLKKIEEILQHHFTAIERINSIAGPLLSNYRKVERSRNAVNEMIRKLKEIFPQEEEPWPPTSFRFGNEMAMSANLEAEWKSIKRERNKASILAEKLSMMFDGYKSLEVQLEEGLNRTNQEQSKFTDYERRLLDSQKMWKKVSANHEGNRYISDGVDQLFATIDQDIQRLRSRYMRGELNYSFTLQAMKQICRKLDEGVVEVDQNQIVDINGEIQRRL